jgi:hypothetical protein
MCIHLEEVFFILNKIIVYYKALITMFSFRVAILKKGQKK